MSINNQGFQIAVYFNEKGEPVIGGVLGFFDKTEDAYSIKPVCDDTLRAIASALSITKSSKVVLETPKERRKAKRINELQTLIKIQN